MIGQTRERVRHASLEPVKWVAIASMTVDHYGKIFEPSWYEATHMAGRLAFPLFCWIVATRLAISPRLGTTYLRRLLPWAIVSQPVWVLVGHDWWHGNVLLTLALGVGLHQTVCSGAASGRLARVALSALLMLPSPWVDFGPVGVAFVPLIAAWTARSGSVGAWAAGPVGVLSNAGLMPPFLKPSDAFALLAAPVAALSLRLRSPLPRLPALVFYAYFPAHLLLLHLIEVHR